jgi:hypothetical protein
LQSPIELNTAILQTNFRKNIAKKKVYIRVYIKEKVKQYLCRPLSGPEDCRSLRLPDFETVVTRRW